MPIERMPKRRVRVGDRVSIYDASGALQHGTVVILLDGELVLPRPSVVADTTPHETEIFADTFARREREARAPLLALLERCEHIVKDYDAEAARMQAWPHGTVAQLRDGLRQLLADIDTVRHAGASPKEGSEP